MKKLAVILLVSLVGTSCIEKEVGCMTGINKEGKREFIRCCGYSQYLAGADVAQGGDAKAENYKDLEWEQVNDCNECQATGIK